MSTNDWLKLLDIGVNPTSLVLVAWILWIKIDNRHKLLQNSIEQLRQEIYENGFVKKDMCFAHHESIDRRLNSLEKEPK